MQRRASDFIGGLSRIVPSTESVRVLKKKKKRDNSEQSSSSRKSGILKSIRKHTFCAKLHSISLYATLVFVLCLLVYVGLSTFLTVCTITGSIRNQELVRERSFDTIAQHLSFVMLEAKSFVRVLQGKMELLAEVYYSGDYDTLIRNYAPELFELEVKIKSQGMSYGWWFYISPNSTTGNGSDVDDHHHLSYTLSHAGLFYDGGNIVIDNGTHKITYDLQYPVQKRDSYPIKEIVPEVAFDQATYDFYSTVHEGYMYWAGYISEYYGYTPYMSYSIGVGPVLEREEYTMAGNSWFGMPIISFSQLMRSVTPEWSASWLLEINQGNILLASSDLGDISEIVSEDLALRSVSYYKDGMVKTVSETLMSDLASILKTGTKKLKMRVGRYQAYIQYLNQSELLGEWLVVNAKPLYRVYEWSVLYTVLVTVVLLIFYGFVGLVCLFITVLVKSGFRRLVRMMEAVQEMDLDAIVPSKRGLLELLRLEDHFLFLVGEMKKYKAFLPRNLRLVGDGSSASTGSGSFGRNDNQHIKSPPGVPCDEEEEEGEEWDTTSLGDSPTKNEGYGDLGDKLCDDSPGNSPDNYNNTDSDEDDDDSDIASVFCVDHIGDGKFRLGLYRKTICTLLIDFAGETKIQKTYHIILKEYSYEYLYDFQPDYVKIVLLNSIRVKFLVVKALAIKKRLQEKGISVKLYLCTGDGIYGNLGNYQIKKFSCGGPVRDEVLKMRENADQSLEFVCDETTGLAIKEGYETRVVNVLKWCEVGRPLSVQENEWFYELAQKESLRRWDGFNDAVALFFEGKLDVAMGLFREFQADYPNDKIVEYWISQIIERSKKTKAKKKMENENIETEKSTKTQQSTNTNSASRSDVFTQTDE